MIALLLATALAAEPAPPEPETRPEPAPPPEGVPVAAIDVSERLPKRWGGIVLPLVSFNSTDGLSLGLGGEIFERQPPPGESYLRKFTFQALVSIDGRYQSHMIRYDTRTGRYDVLAEIGFHAWTGHLYAGSGSQAVTVDWDDAENGNRAWSPYAMFGVSQPLGAGMLYQQVYGRFMQVFPGEGSLLEADAPTGFEGGWYGDATLGWYIEEYDRWPLPDDGWRFEVDTRLGGALVDDQAGLLPQAGAHVEAIRWWPVSGPWLVVGTRVTAAWAFGDRPFFEEEFIGGRRRAEIGYDKALTGYGRTRTRGPGVVAALIEIRPFFYRTNHPFFDVGFYASLFAEEAFLLDKDGGAGPHLPTLGVGPVILWQGATMLRPFIAWGWRSASPDDPRKPMPQFGLTLTDPL